MQNFKSNKQAKGFSLLELMLVLAAIVFLGALAINQYNKYRVNQSAAEEAQNLATAAAAVKALYTRGDFTSLNASVAAKAKFFPDNMVNTAGTAITNQWNGAVTLGYLTNADAVGTGVAITPGTGGPSAGSPNRFFGISYAAVPSDVCIKLAGAAGPTFDKIVINGTIVKNTVPGVATQQLLNEAEVATQCGNNASGGRTMIFITN